MFFRILSEFNYCFPCCNNHDLLNYQINIAKSYKDLQNKPKEIGIDYRVNLQNTIEAKSSLDGINLNSQYKTSQIFLIKDGNRIIGTATLLCTPSIYFSKLQYLYYENQRVYTISFQDINGNCISDSYCIEFGFFYLLPSYRNKRIAKFVLHDYLIPTIKKTTRNFEDKIYILCSSKGVITLPEISKSIHNFSDHFDKTQTFQLTENDLLHLGETHIESEFTTYMANKFNIKRIKNIYNLSLGPVFISKLSDLIPVN